MRHTNQSFSDKSKIVHKDKYDYSKVEYKSNKEKVIIICPTHGEFCQLAQDHMRGRGCEKCTGRFPIDEKEFLKRAKSKHGDKYNYSKSNYIGWQKPIYIECKIHGVFETKPSTHCLTNGACKRCTGKEITTEDAITKFIETHGEQYDYSKVDYKSSKTKIEIICKEHGSFKQIPNSHLRGIGCPQCGVIKANVDQSNKKGFYCIPRAERHKKKWLKEKATVYFIKITTPTESFYKVGITVQKLKNRFSCLKRENTTYEVIFQKETNLYEACHIEHDIIEKYKDYQYTPQTKMKSGNTECFSIELDITK